MQFIHLMFTIYEVVFSMNFYYNFRIINLPPNFDIPMRAVNGIYSLRKYFTKYITWINEYNKCINIFSFLKKVTPDYQSLFLQNLSHSP